MQTAQPYRRREHTEARKTKHNGLHTVFLSSRAVRLCCIASSDGNHRANAYGRREDDLGQPSTEPVFPLEIPTLCAQARRHMSTAAQRSRSCRRLRFPNTRNC